MRLSDDGLELIKSHEGLRLEAYPDPGSGGEPWTVGYGHTGDVKEGDEIDEAEASRLLREDVASAEQCVERHVDVALEQYEFDALVSFVFNVGCGNFSASTMLKLINAGNKRAAAAQFGRWNKAAGKTMAGLVRRRQAEKEVFLMKAGFDAGSLK